jgi:hypothetical protein
MYRSYRLSARKYTILIHIIVWLIVFFLPALFFDTAEARYRYLIQGWPLQVILALYFYFNYLFLIPRYL